MLAPERTCHNSAQEDRSSSKGRDKATLQARTNTIEEETTVQHNTAQRRQQAAGQACVSVLVRMSECVLCVSFIFLFSFLRFYQNIQIIIKLETCHYFLGYFALYHWNSHGLEMYYYNSSYWKYAIGTLGLPEKSHSLRLLATWAHCQVVVFPYGRLCPCVHPD
jgi:hypothetical protein